MLARNVTEFYSQWQPEVDTFLKENGWNKVCLLLFLTDLIFNEAYDFSGLEGCELGTQLSLFQFYADLEHSITNDTDRVHILVIHARTQMFKGKRTSSSTASATVTGSAWVRRY